MSFELPNPRSCEPKRVMRQNSAHCMGDCVKNPKSETYVSV